MEEQPLGPWQTSELLQLPSCGSPPLRSHAHSHCSPTKLSTPNMLLTCMYKNSVRKFPQLRSVVVCEQRVDREQQAKEHKPQATCTGRNFLFLDFQHRRPRANLVFKKKARAKLSPKTMPTSPGHSPHVHSPLKKRSVTKSAWTCYNTTNFQHTYHVEKAYLKFRKVGKPL